MVSWRATPLFALIASAILLVALAVSPAYALHGFEPLGLGRAVATQEHFTADLLSIRGVVGTAVGLAANGDPVVKIYTAGEGVAGLPRELDGVPVVVQVTGKIYAIKKPDCIVDPSHPSCNKEEEEVGAVDPKSWFDRPVPIGISSGNVESIEIVGIFITCSSGTLGARVTNTNGGSVSVYALSNNHIYALENTATESINNIVQPAPGDADPVCGDNSGPDPGDDTIGTLAAFVPIMFDGLDDPPTENHVDAAIASTTAGLVGAGTPPADGYGTPSSFILACDATCENLLGESIQKYGRTTGLTKGTITGINATILVGYDSGVAQFVGQIEVTGKKGGFFKGGDSGSLVVVDGGSDHLRPVGLLFAGPRSGKTGFANQIEEVLSELSARPGVGALSVDDGT